MRIEEALMAIEPGPRPGLEAGGAPGLSFSPTQSGEVARKEDHLDKAVLIDGPDQQSLPPSRRLSQTSVAPGGLPVLSSVSATCASLELLHSERRQYDVLLHAK